MSRMNDLLAANAQLSEGVGECVLAIEALRNMLQRGLADRTFMVRDGKRIYTNISGKPEYESQRRILDDLAYWDTCLAHLQEMLEDNEAAINSERHRKDAVEDENGSD